MDDSYDRTASLMTPAKLAQVSKARAPVPPARWLDQMAADAGHHHVERLQQLCRALQKAALERDPSSLTAMLAPLGRALPELDFSLLQARGWLSRATGKSRSAGAEFSAQFERIDAIATELPAQLQGWLAQQIRVAGTVDRTLVEFEVEYRAVDKVLDQAARWLQDMRVQLEEHPSAAADGPSMQHVQDDAGRCEILIARLKLLRTVAVAAQQVHGHLQSVVAGRAALRQVLQQGVVSRVKVWESRLTALAAASTASGSEALGLDAPMQAHRDLQLGAQRALADNEQLQGLENILVQSLGALDEALGSAR